jgi:hypothetical protein
MNRFRFDLEGTSTLEEGFPLPLSLQGDVAQTLIQLRAIQSFDTRAMSYAIQRTVRCAARRPIEELFDDLALHMVAAFVARYLASREAVLILQGPPGTGKTRLVRAILAALSARKGDSARVLYTADQRALDNDEIFVEFITGSHDAFVIEDADHLLMARANGNVDLHRFLAIADGVVRAQGRKIIFTTNLPNVGDIDDALVRPGRCFATVRTRALELGEAAALAARLGADLALPTGLRSISLAAFYKLIDDARAAAPPAST